jgi:hypothetical protein
MCRIPFDENLATRRRETIFKKLGFLSMSHPTIPAMRMNTTSHSLPRQRTPSLAVIGNTRPLLRSATYLVLESFQKAPATIRATGARLERGFAARAFLKSDQINAS